MTDSVHEILLKGLRPNPEDTGVKVSLSNENSLKLMLKNFKFIRILKINAKLKQICLECTFSGKPVVLILEKNPFDGTLIEKIGNNFGHVLHDVKNLFHNDIYGSYLVDLVFGNSQDDLLLNKIFMSIIHPAGPEDIKKYLEHSVSMIRETPELYEKVTKHYIQEQISTPGRIQWLYNILDGKAELDRVIYSHDDFLIVKDMKWKCDQTELSQMEKLEIYLTALVVRRDLFTLRDLNETHLPLLESIYDRGRQVISEKYLIPLQELRVFIHYQPSFYHLHIHFTHIKNEHHGFQCERAHLLSMVIENIRLVPDYYQKVTLEFPLSDASKLKF